MLFYEDFVKKIDSTDKIQLKKFENFSVEVKKLVSGLGIGVPLILIRITSSLSIKGNRVKNSS